MRLLLNLLDKLQSLDKKISLPSAASSIAEEATNGRDIC